MDGTATKEIYTLALHDARRIEGYLGAGNTTDHEATTAEEALEKIRKSMMVLVREGYV